ncbi:predicted protein [Histoplasma capsulatum G186AR]|uniref:Uncharacterized protein n=1 Tax=Ajellomyces capsulatus (strain G186AR / H82 / ATCC MYA-2454 / RMSCC 2432) TaxID=447093 RepID=C0NQR9_AJECG|nr:uncharacterized protein HCBG_05349 [Histoplasma capsulatum G186AR]EEH06033.1 predicted protein [Histoplasma capsulatum G186AR]
MSKNAGLNFRFAPLDSITHTEDRGAEWRSANRGPQNQLMLLKVQCSSKFKEALARHWHVRASEAFSSCLFMNGAGMIQVVINRYSLKNNGDSGRHYDAAETVDKIKSLSHSPSAAAYRGKYTPQRTEQFIIMVSMRFKAIASRLD